MKIVQNMNRYIRNWRPQHLGNPLTVLVYTPTVRNTILCKSAGLVDILY